MPVPRTKVFGSTVNVQSCASPFTVIEALLIAVIVPRALPPDVDSAAGAVPSARGQS